MTLNPRPSETDFVMIVVAKREAHKNVNTECDANVMLCLNEDLNALYGPTLSGFMDPLILSGRVSLIEADSKPEEKKSSEF